MRPNEQDRRLREQERKEKAQTTPQQTRDEAKKASVSACTRTGPSGSGSDTPPPRSSAPHYAAGRTRRDPAESMTTSRRCRLRPRTRVPHLSGQAPAPRVPWMSTMPTVEVASTRRPHVGTDQKLRRATDRAGSGEVVQEPLQRAMYTSRREARACSSLLGMSRLRAAYRGGRCPSRPDASACRYVVRGQSSRRLLCMRET